MLKTALPLILSFAGAAQAAETVPFDARWKTQRLTLFGPQNEFSFNGEAVRVTSDDAVSLAYLELDPDLWTARGARWDWSVDTGVAATDLTRKGGDDRNLALYFMFVPQDQAPELRGTRVTDLLTEESARILVYVWGGDHAAGEMLESPYLDERGRTIVAEPAGTGAAKVAADLASDYRRAFGSTPGALVGIAVSADSDDTDGRIEATVSNLRLE